MNTTPSASPESNPNLSGLGRALLGTNEGSKPSGPWVPPTAEELHALLPQYEIVKMLGRGGMGAVYMGTQTALERPVAIKILSSALEDSDAGFTERFKNEAKAMAKLNHPGIVSVYDFGEAPGGLLYIVMEYVDGTDVAKMIAAKGRLHTEHAMAITAHVCDALAYAHERGIIHRDIKPANIMVGYDGEVKVADFGLAKVNVGGKTLGLTMSGMAMGTLHFMAPEALMLGTAVDHRADIYAVGVMLYQMLTGKLPQGMFKMPSLQVPGLDPRYDGIIAKAMMEDREARYQSAREMRSSLDAILTQPVVKADPAVAQAPQAALPTQARPQRPGARLPQPVRSTPAPPPPAKKGIPFGWIATLLLLAAATGAYLFKSQQSTPPGTTLKAPTSAPAAIQPQAHIRVLTPDAVRVLKLEKGQPRLHDSNPLRTIEGVAAGLKDWQFTSIPQRIDNEYTIQVEKAGVIYAFGAVRTGSTPQDVLGGNHARWENAAGDIAGALVKFCYKRSVSAGETLKFKAFELQFAAPTINLEVTSAAATAAMTGSSSPVLKAASEESTDGWISLFNGKDLAGWRPIGNPQGFSVDQGSIRTGGVRADLIYTGLAAAPATFRDFEVQMRVKTGRQGNSGLWFHLPTAIQSTQECDQALQVQIDNGFDKQRTGSVVHIQPLAQSPVADGDWFDLRVLVQNKTVTAFVDGRQVNQWSQPENWIPPAKAALARMGSGTIGVESWKGNVWFQDIRLRLLEAPKPASQPDEKHILGRWVRTNMDRPGPAYLMDLSADGSALWTGDNTTVRGTWKLKAGVWEVDWNSRFKFLITPPTSTAPAILKGTANWPDGKSTEIVYERLAPASPSVATTSEEGFVPLFEKESLSGWTGDLSSYQMRNGVLSSGKGSLTNTKPYGDFSLKFDLRLGVGSYVEMSIRGQDPPQPNRGAPNASFGVVLRDDADASAATLEPWQKNGAIYGYQAALRASGGIAGTWNECEIRVENQHLTVQINGVLVQDTELSKLTRKAPGGRSLDLSRTRGQLAILGFKGSAEFRNMRIKELGASSDAVAPTASATLWIDTKGRTLQAKFIRAEGSNVLLDIAGKVTPVAMASLSSASQEIARRLQAALPPAEPDSDWLIGQWHQTNDGRSYPIYLLEFKADHTATFAGGNLRTTGQWTFSNEAIAITWSNGASYRISVPSNKPSTDLGGTIFDIDGRQGSQNKMRMQKAGAAADAGWVPLFPGDSLSGWTGGVTSYRIADGILTGTGRGDLISPKEYGSFHLKFDLRISAEANSGIGIWREASTGATAGAPHGFEVQIQDDTAPKYRTQEFWQRHGGIYYFKEPLALSMNPVGSWNTHEILVEGTQIKVTINGKLVQDADVTKLRPATPRAPVLDVSRKRGHLMILGRNGVAEFRNMQIKELP